MWTGGLVLLLAASVSAITRDQFYPYGHGVDQRLPRGAEVSSPEIGLSVPIVFYGETYESIFVSTFIYYFVNYLLQQLVKIKLMKD